MPNQHDLMKTIEMFESQNNDDFNPFENLFSSSHSDFDDEDEDED